MSDRSAATIEIGGPIRLDDIDQLADAMENEGVSDDWDMTGPGADRESIERAINEKRTITVYNTEARGGMFDDYLEPACIELGLTWRRCDDGHYAYTAGHAAWQPGMDKPIESGGTTESGPQIDLSVIRTAAVDGKLAVLLKRLDPLDLPIPPLTLAA